MRYALAILIALVATPAAAISIMDGSGADWSNDEKAVIAAMALQAKSLDPYATQAINLRRGRQTANFKVWCGDINMIDKNGRKTGFRPFQFQIKDGVPAGNFAGRLQPREMDDMIEKAVRSIQKKSGC